MGLREAVSEIADQMEKEIEENIGELAELSME